MTLPPWKPTNDEERRAFTRWIHDALNRLDEAALAKVRADKVREADDGFDGSWVAHPDLVPICREVFDSVLGSAPNQLDRERADVLVSADLLDRIV